MGKPVNTLIIPNFDKKKNSIFVGTNDFTVNKIGDKDSHIFRINARYDKN